MIEEQRAKHCSKPMISLEEMKTTHEDNEKVWALLRKANVHALKIAVSVKKAEEHANKACRLTNNIIGKLLRLREEAEHLAPLLLAILRV